MLPCEARADRDRPGVPRKGEPAPIALRQLIGILAAIALTLIPQARAESGAVATEIIYARPGAGAVTLVWGINGCASVVSVMLATLLAMHWGFTVVTWLAVGLYGTAVIIWDRIDRHALTPARMRTHRRDNP